MPDHSFEPESLAELTRYLQYIVGGIEKQLTELSGKVDRLDVVSREQHREDINALRAEQRESRDDIDKLQDKITSQGRWIIGSIVYPLVGFALTIWATAHGVN